MLAELRMIKNAWKNPKQMGENVDVFEEAVQEDQRQEVCNTTPPPYTELSSKDHSGGTLPNTLPNSSTSYLLLTEYAKMEKINRCAQLQWSLMEIMAVTFSTDCQRLKAALIKMYPAWASTHIEDPSSTTDKEGRALVAEMSTLVRNLEKEITRNRWLLVHKRDKDLAEKIVLEPVEDLGMNLDFVLEVLGRYERVEGRRRPESTLVDYWMSPPSTDLGDAIASHALLLQSFVLGKEARFVLEDYIATFQREKGLEELCTSKELQEESLSLEKACGWPLSDGYMDLARGLRGLKTSDVMHDLFEPSRTRLKEARKLRKH